MEIGPDRVIRGRLGRAVRRVRAVGRLLAESLRRIERQVAVHLARRDVVETDAAFEPAGFQQGLRADHVGAKERARIHDRATVVGLCREVDDLLDPPGPQDRTDERGVDDVTWYELGSRAGDIVRDRRVGQRVQNEYRVGGMLRTPPMDEVRSDETRPAGDEDIHRTFARNEVAASAASGSPASRGDRIGGRTGQGIARAGSAQRIPASFAWALSAAGLVRTWQTSPRV